MRHDLAERRIPNSLILGSIITSLVCAAMGWNPLAGAGLAGIQHWACGLLTGFGCFIPLYMVRVMGAGDVKLMAACSACLGPDLAWPASLMALMLGGVLAVIWVVWRDMPNHLLFPHVSTWWLRANGVLSKMAPTNNSTSHPPLPGTALQKTAAKLPFSLAITGACLSAIFTLK